MKYLPLLFIAALFICSGQSCASSNACTGYFLEQKDSVTGEFQIEITADAINVKSLSNGYSLIARAPTWQVMIFRRAESLAITQSLRDWHNYGLVFRGPSGAQTVRKLGLNKARQTIYMGIAASISQGPRGAIIDRANKDPAKAAMYHTQSAISSELATYIVSRSIPVRPEQLAILEGLYYLPALNGVPLHCSYRTLEQRVVNTLTTQKLSHHKFASSDFDYPKGFATANDLQAVIIGSQRKKLIEDMLGGPKD